MSDDPTGHPDADEIVCRRCKAQPGEICRRPDGARAKTVHAIRRRDAREAAQSAEQTQPPRPGKGRHKTPGSFDPGRASEAAVKAGQAKRRRSAEAAAAREAAAERLRLEAVQTEAEALARNDVLFEKDRVILKRLVLDTTLAAWRTAKTAIDGIRRVELDEDSRPKRVPVEEVSARGVVRTTEVDDYRGAYTPDAIGKLVTAAGVALDKLRLEEGKPTSHNRTDGPADRPLESLTDAELIAALRGETFPP